jgi:hypothetical protein
MFSINKYVEMTVEQKQAYGFVKLTTLEIKMINHRKHPLQSPDPVIVSE